jgi:pimeloyl-ACP methyl ester carboxylesterase
MPFAHSRGCRIYYTVIGEPGLPTLTLVRGLARSARYWGPLLPHLEEHFRVVLLDNRGVGRSDAPPPPYSTARMAADVAAVLDDAAVERTHVFGMSLGGMIAQQVALLYADRVERLVLGCTTHGGRRATRNSWRSALAILRASRMPPREAAYFMAPHLISTEAMEAHPERIEEWAEFAESDPASVLGLMGQASAALRHDTESRLGNIAAPTLVLSGDDDRLIPVRNSELLADKIPGAELRLLPGAGHDFTTDRPRVAATVVKEFLLSRAGR